MTCVHGNTVDPSREFRPDSSDCGVCWPGRGKAPPRPARTLPCVHEGPVREWCTSCTGAAADLRHVRTCDLHDEHCTRGASRVRSCSSCPDYQTGRREVHFHLSAHGIGDAVVGVYVACGLAEAGHSAVFHTRQAHWLAGVSHPGMTLAPWRRDMGADGNADYRGQLRTGAFGTGKSRARWYCDQVARQEAIPPFSPARPKSVDHPTPVILGEYTLLAPFANWHTRNWPLERWADLARTLSGLGERVVVVGTSDKRERMASALGGLPASVSWHWGMPPAWVVSAVANASHVYGNDSGIVHLAGLHGVPATAVVAHLPGAFLFDCAPTVKWVSPDGWACVPCGWQGDRGYRRGCDGRCPALASVTAERVALPVLPQHELDARLGDRVERLVGAGG